MADITLLPSAKVPLIYPDTSGMTTEWYRFFWNVYGFTGDATGAVPVSKGGTGLTSIGEHQLIIGNAAGVFEKTELIGNGITITYAPGTTTLAIGNSGVTPGTYGSASAVGQFTVDAKGTLVFAQNIPIAIDATQIISGTIASARISGSYTGITGVGTLTAGTWNATTIGTAYGGTGLTSFTSGGALYATSTSALTSGTLPVTAGGTGQTSFTNGQLLIGNTTGNTLTKATLTAGSGVSITNGTGSITISATGLGGDVVGPASATDNAIARFDSTTGKLIQNSVVTISDTGATTGITTLSASTSVTTPIIQASNSAGLALKNASGTTQISMGAGGGDNLTIAVATNINGANAQIDISPTGTGHVHIKPSGSGAVEIAPTNAGTMNNMVIGGITPLAITGTTITATTFNGSGSGLTSIPNSALTNSTISGVALGGNLFNLTAGTGVSFSAGTTYNGSAAITINATGTGGTVTSVAALTLGTTGTDLSSTVANSTTTPVITLNVPTASATNRGALSAADWTTFNSKQPAGTYVTSVTGTAPVVSSGGTTPAISMAAATTSVSGYLTSTDWNTFNSKGSGSVTSVAATVPSFLSITGSPITTSGTLAISYSGTALPILNGGTGQTTASAAFNALSPLTTAGDVLYGGTSGAGTRLAIGTAGQVLTVNAGATAPQWSTPTTGTVTSVAQSFTGGLISVAGSPITTSGTLALTVAGTSGGIPYFSSTTAWASSALLAANALMIGGGAGVAPSTITTGTGVVTALGVNTGTAGAFVVNGGALGTPSSGTVTNLTGTASININGTVGATTATTGVFTTATANSFIPNLSTVPTNGMYLPAANSVGIATNSTERMRIISTGFVGIGTSSPARKLTVSDADQGSARIRIDNTSGRAYDLVSGIDGVLQSGFSIFDATGAATRFTIFASGGISIGNTTDPGATNLSVTGTGQFGTTVGVGAATPSTSGAGITFPATQSNSSDVNTLDDYEEGTWTPAQGAGIILVGSYSSSGKYTKVGRQVTVVGQINGSTSVAVSAGGLLCTGLPFTTNTAGGAAVFTGGLTNAAVTATSLIVGSVTTLYATTAVAATTSFYFSATYLTD
jgi:hypothetical protein